MAVRRPVRTAHRTELLGVPVDIIDSEDVLDFVASAAEQDRKAIVVNHNLHSIHLIRKNPDMAALYERADVIEIDSMPLILWGKLLGAPVWRGYRSTYLDWREAFWAMAQAHGWRVFYLGGAPGVAEEAARRLVARWPGVEIATRHGYFDQAKDSADNAAVVAEINAFAPHILFVGMGMPIQEAWITQNYEDIEHGVVLPVGAAFDYEAGVQLAAPRVLGELGLEWLFRLACQPRRLFGRYMIEPWTLVGLALKDLGRHLSGKKGAQTIRRIDLRPPLEVREIILESGAARLAA